MSKTLEILKRVANGEVTPEDAEAELLVLSFVSGNEGRNKLNLPPIKKRKKPEVAVCDHPKSDLVDIEKGIWLCKCGTWIEAN